MKQVCATLSVLARDNAVRVLENEIQMIIETGDQPAKTLKALQEAVIALERATKS